MFSKFVRLSIITAIIVSVFVVAPMHWQARSL